MSPGRAYALFALVCLIFSTTWLAIRIGLSDLPPLGAAGLRFLVAFPILLTIVRTQRRPWPRTAAEWRLPIQIALTMFAIPFSLIYWAEQTVPSGLAAVLFASFAFFVALLAHFVLHDEPMTTPRIIGIVLGFLGVIVVFQDRMHGASSWLGEAAMVLTAAIQASASVAIRRSAGKADAVILSCVGAGVGAVLLLGASFALGEPLLAGLTLKGVATIVYLAVFGSVIAFTLSIRLIQVLGATRMAMTVYITPVAALLWGRLVLGETLGPGLWLGASFVLVGVWLAGRARPALVPSPAGGGR